MVSSLANLGGFAGPYAIGWIKDQTGSLYGGLAVGGVSLFASATLMLLLPKRLRGTRAKVGERARLRLPVCGTRRPPEPQKGQRYLRRNLGLKSFPQHGEVAQRFEGEALLLNLRRKLQRRS